VQAPCGVLLDDERERPMTALRVLQWRLSGARKIALGAVLVEWR